MERLLLLLVLCLRVGVIAARDVQAKSTRSDNIVRHKKAKPDSEKQNDDGAFTYEYYTDAEVTDAENLMKEHARSRKLFEGSCASNAQCTGTNEVCKNLICSCSPGYYFNSNTAQCTQNAAGQFGAGSITYSTPPTATAWFGITASPDMQFMLASVRGGNLYKSLDRGVTWTEITSAGTKDWREVFASHDFSVLAAVAGMNGLWYSSDRGTTWSQKTTPVASLNGFQVSPTFVVMVATVGDPSNLSTKGYVLKSDNSGASWSQITSAGSRSWGGVTASTDFSKIVAVTNDEFMYVIRLIE